jgi:hypothetical protein
MTLKRRPPRNSFNALVLLSITILTPHVWGHDAAPATAQSAASSAVLERWKNAGSLAIR